MAHCTEFEAFLWDSFRHGQTIRELRLSKDEIQQLQAYYPAASLEEASLEQEGKAWYWVTLPAPGSACGA